MIFNFSSTSSWRLLNNPGIPHLLSKSRHRDSSNNTNVFDDQRERTTMDHIVLFANKIFFLQRLSLASNILAEIVAGVSEAHNRIAVDHNDLVSHSNITLNILICYLLLLSNPFIVIWTSSLHRKMEQFMTSYCYINHNWFGVCLCVFDQFQT